MSFTPWDEAGARRVNAGIARGIRVAETSGRAMMGLAE
jgi:hypothetical protein